MKRKYMTIVTMLSAISLAACGQTTTTSVSNSTANAQTENSTATDEKPSSDDDASGVNADTDQDRVADKDNNDEEDATSGEETTITVQDGSIKTKGDGVEVDGSTITITEAGTYRFSGTLEDGKIVIDAKKKEVVVINGGTLKINADGDGIDSNGDLTINGGSIIVYGPENSGNSAIDYNGTGGWRNFNNRHVRQNGGYLLGRIYAELHRILHDKYRGCRDLHRDCGCRRKYHL